MYELRLINYEQIEGYDADYCRRAMDLEVPEDCSWYGVFRDNVLVAYFAVQDSSESDLFIRRYYILPDARKQKVERVSIHLLSQAAKAAGYKTLVFETWRNGLAYARFVKPMGFKMVSAEFVKEL